MNEFIFYLISLPLLISSSALVLYLIDIVLISIGFAGISFDFTEVCIVSVVNAVLWLGYKLLDEIRGLGRIIENKNNDRY